MNLKEIYKLFLTTSGPVMDTRKDCSNKMFFALKGPNFNANLYAEKALEKGASYALVDEKLELSDDRIIQVGDVLKTMQDLGLHHKKSLQIPVIGITGTNGKTTNKELLQRLLSKKYSCFATKGNLNNQIGVPFSLLEMSSHHEIAVIEMGANRMGDIKELSALADPDYAYITNIGIAHLEGFKSKDNIKIEKGDLFRYVEARDRTFFLNTSEPEVKDIASQYSHTVSAGESSQDDYIFELMTSIPKIQLKFEGQVIESNLYGDHNYENVKMSIAIARHFKVGLESIKEALAEYKPKNNRSQILRSEDLLIFLDAYNANPSSMQTSVESFAKFAADRKVLILGDMLELGPDSERHHSDLLEKISHTKWTDVILVGSEFARFKNNFEKYAFFLDLDAVNAYIEGRFDKGFTILVKGSRGIALEKLELIQRLK